MQTDISCISVQKIERIKEININWKKIIIIDADCEDDFQAGSKTIGTMSEKPIIVGCAGFARYLTRLIEGSYNFEPQTIKHRITGHADKHLIVCGTLNGVSREQIEYARSKGCELITIPIDMNAYETKRVLNEFQSKLAINDCILLETPNEIIDCHPQDICRNAAAFLSKIVNCIDSFSLVVFGGDTLQEILDVFHCRQIIPRDEVCTGVVLSEILCDIGEIILISKSGGFGDKDTVVKIIIFLKTLG